MIPLIERFSGRLLWLGLGLEAGVVVLAWMEAQGHASVFFQSAARWSGRVSLLFFVLLLVYATVRPGFDRAKADFEVKYLLYRDFAILHVIHWCLLAVSVGMGNFELFPIRIIAGALAYAMVVLMPLAIRGRWFSERVLGGWQGIYLFWVWLIFLMTYSKRLSGESPTATGTPAVWWPLFFLLIVLIFWRAVYWLMEWMGTAQRRPRR